LLEELKAGPRYLERLVVKTEGRVFFLDIDDLNYIEAEGNYVRVHTGNKSHLLRETISGLESQLDPKKFLRIHRSAIVKIERIKELQPWFHGEYHVILENGKQLTLSRNYRSNLQEAVGKPL
jgi:two-component system LytT family response regulator